METIERTAPETAPQPRQRRVGTFTLGVTLLAAGALMLAAMFFPQLDLRWALKCAPVILILLGVETLIAAKGGGRIKYDWAGMLLCFVLTGAALCMCAAAWFVSWWPENGHYYEGSRTGNESCLILDYTAFNGTEFQLLELEAGDTIRAEIAGSRGSVGVEIIGDESRECIFESDDLAAGAYSIEVPEDGGYEVWVTGRQASGSASFIREPGA